MKSFREPLIHICTEFLNSYLSPFKKNKEWDLQSFGCSENVTLN